MNWYAHPESKILLIPILPRSDFNEEKNQTAEVFAKLQAVNPLIKPLADGDRIIWFDIASKFRHEDGSINEALFKDHLHPNKSGYQVWAEELAPYLKGGTCFIPAGLKHQTTLMPGYSEVDYVDESAGALNAYEVKWNPSMPASPASRTFSRAYHEATGVGIFRENYMDFLLASMPLLVNSLKCSSRPSPGRREQGRC